eukprot:TRINITY_DN5718_c0_g1_i2.p1 TRINITY_DN5718_c0_g1~~TRINITY_DN5718_c0_g1_i2.p1  ORF type:complete len:476 (-),score=68.27 TRINITY_DN5718_c0_g1_i2:65-1492(-)
MNGDPDRILKDFLDLYSKVEEKAKSTAFKHGPYKEWTELPEIKFKKAVSGEIKETISGPHLATDNIKNTDTDANLIKHIVYGRAISTYPDGMGIPICDYYCAQLYEKRTFICLADGCGWGKKSREAAVRAANAFMEYLNKRHTNICDLRDAGRSILRCFHEAHSQIIEGYEDVLDAGTTTMCGGIVLQLDDTESETLERLKKTSIEMAKIHRMDFDKLKTQMPQTQVIKNIGRILRSRAPHKITLTGGEGDEYTDRPEEESSSDDEADLEEELSIPKWLFVCASVGDCKAFHYSVHTKKFTDVTAGNRTSLTDAKDPGGFLGPSGESGSPDLRNFALYMMPCRPGDLIFIVSDGIHDNLDPQHLGLSPTAVGVSGNFTNWLIAEQKVPDETDDFKNAFRLRLLKKLADQVNLSKSAPLPESLTAILLKHSFQLTSNSRNFIENNPRGGRVPHDYAKFPGKMDHTTCVVCVVDPKS